MLFAEADIGMDRARTQLWVSCLYERGPEALDGAGVGRKEVPWVPQVLEVSLLGWRDR